MVVQGHEMSDFERTSTDFQVTKLQLIVTFHDKVSTRAGNRNQGDEGGARDADTS